MQTVKKTLFTFFLCLIILGGSFAGYIWWQHQKTEQIIQAKEKAKALIEASTLIEKIWREGVDHDLGCKSAALGNYKRVNENYLRCNPDFLNCWLGQVFPRKFRGEEISLQPLASGSLAQIISRENTAIQQVPAYGLLLSLKAGEKRNQGLKIILEDSCRDTYLPQRIYGYGPYATVDWRWDNFNRHIFVDRFLVTNRDVNEWIKHSSHPSQKELKPETDPNKIPLVANHLNLDQMRGFCQFRGKELLEALVFDAAAFHPGDYAITKPKRSFRGPFPWSRKRKDSYLYKASLNNEFSFKNEFCLKVFTSECRKDFIFDTFAPLASSWTGMVSTLGGPFEAFRNPLEPKKNLKISSFYYKIFSLWHRLGARSFWDGEERGFTNIEWHDDPPRDRSQPSYEIGFRCMKRRFGFAKN